MRSSDSPQRAAERRIYAAASASPTNLSCTLVRRADLPVDGLACQRTRCARRSPRDFMKPIQIPSDGGKKLNVLGIPMVIRIHGRDTGGVVSAVESHDVPGGGPPPHIHHR